jgi:putative tributyrin esterase
MRPLILFLAFLLLFSCSQTEAMKLPAPGLYTIQVDGVDVDLIVPMGDVRGTLLVLPGWNFPRDSWRKNSRIEKMAEKAGLILVLPEMGKTLYETDYFPETQMKWHRLPGSVFVKEKLIADLQARYLILRPGQKNLLLGLSTGGRGVAMLALENPGLFTAGAAFSGDFAQEKMKLERINIAVYGPFNEKRWMGRDNPNARVPEWKMPIYLSHGLSDDVVPPQQTQVFADAIRARSADLVDFHLKAGFGHDYRFWDAELDAAFAFFEKYLQTR